MAGAESGSGTGGAQGLARDRRAGRVGAGSVCAARGRVVRGARQAAGHPCDHRATVAGHRATACGGVVTATTSPPDYARFDDLLSDEERTIRDRVRAFVDQEALPLVADYYE